MIQELLKILNEAEVLIDNQSQWIVDVKDILKKVHSDLQGINETLKRVNLRDNSTSNK